jgi:hypothetical protein
VAACCRRFRDVATIRARMEELRRERKAAHAIEGEAKSDPPMRSNRNAYSSQQEIQRGARTGPTIWHDTQLGSEKVCWSRCERSQSTRPRWRTGALSIGIARLALWFRRGRRLRAFAATSSSCVATVPLDLAGYEACC